MRSKYAMPAIALAAVVASAAALDTPLGGWLQSLFFGAGIRWADAYKAMGSVESNPRDRAGLTPLARALRYPAVSGNGPVDTREVVEILQRFGAIDPDATAKTAGGKQPDGEREAVYSAALPIRQRADNPWLWKGVQNALLYAGVRHEVAEIRPLIEGALLTVEVRFKGCAPPHDRTRVINDANSWTIAKGSPVRCGEPADKAFEPSAPD